jgi:hypothetical protein
LLRERVSLLRYNTMPVLFACTLNVLSYLTVWDRFHAHSKKHRIYPKYRGVFAFLGLFIFTASRDISVSIVTELQATYEKSWFGSRQEQENFIFSSASSTALRCPKPEPEPTQPSLQWVLDVVSAGWSRWSVNLTAYLHSLPRSRKHQTLLTHPTPAQGEYYITLPCFYIFLDKFPCYLLSKYRRILDSICFFSLLATYFPFCPSVLGKHITMQHTNEMCTYETVLAYNCGPGSSVGIATGYGLDGPRIESRWGRDFSHTSRPALRPSSLLYNGYRVFPGVKAAGVWCWPPTPSSAEVKKE